MCGLASVTALAGCATQSTGQQAAGPSAQATQAARSDDQQLLDQAHTSLTNFLRDPDMSWLQQHIGQAQGVLVAPTVVRAGFIFGGAGGRAVLYTRDQSTGRWIGPAFYNLAAASVGLQAGVAVSEDLTLVMSRSGVDSLLSPSVKLGGQVSVAAGPVGAGAAADVTSDFVAFARAKGVYGGLNLEGSVISVAESRHGRHADRAERPGEQKRGGQPQLRKRHAGGTVGQQCIIDAGAGSRRELLVGHADGRVEDQLRARSAQREGL